MCPPERLKSQHRPYSPFDILVILLNQIVQLLALPDGHPFFFWFAGVECGQGGRVGATFIDGDDLWFTVMTNGLAKETQRSGGVSPGSQQEVDGLSCSIYRAVQIFPLAFDFDVGFVHAPPPTHGALMSTKRLIQRRHQTDNPAVKRRMVNDDAARGHHFFEIAQAKGISQIPASALGNDIDGIVQTLEGISDQRYGQATSQKKQYVT